MPAATPDDHPVVPNMSTPTASRARRFFQIGGPAFNAGLVVVLGSLSAFIVASPVRAAAGGGDKELALDEQSVDWTGLGDLSAGGSAGGAVPAAAPSGLGGMVVRGVEVSVKQAGTTTSTSTSTSTSTTRPPATTTSTAAPTTTTAPAAGLRSTLGLQNAASTTCNDFGSWLDAQAVYATNPAAYWQLDGDNDGRACEGLPGTPAETSPVSAAPTTSTTKAPAPPTTAVKVWFCPDFPTQPEAQAAFDRDRIGFAQLDGDKDGVACEGLPGTPGGEVDTFTVPTKAELLSPAEDLYGLHTAESPWWFGEVDTINATTGKAPSAVTFFQKFSQPFPTAAVGLAWTRHAVPIITWEPVIPGSGTGQPKLRDIYSGTWDSYIDAWASAAKAQGQPVVIRFAPEMNGTWYTWAEGAYGNASGDYVKAWRYLHDRFSAVGADNVLWLWSPNRVDQQHTPLSAVYPGDAYVDWVGMSAYYREATGAPDFATTFGATLSALRSVSDKPIWISETGADSGDDANDVAWTQNLFAGLAAQPDVIGFSWFNEEKSNNDWRLQRSANVFAAFAAGLTDPRYRGGKLVS